MSETIILEKRQDKEIIRSLIEENARLSGEIAVDMDCAKYARKAILTERARRNESGLPFDVGFACGLSFALGAFSGVCEEGSEKP